MKKLILLSVLLFSFMTYAEDTQESEMEDKALMQATESMITQPVEKESVRTPAALETNETETTTSAPDENDSTKNKQENQIPAFREAKAKVEKPQSMWTRLVMSLIVVLVVAGGLIFATRRWAKTKNAIGGQAKVKINHQLHLGPKKSVALIEVAGEHLLIGVTDHNINLLKTLSIINDEIPESVPHDFEEVMQEDFQFAKNLDVRIR